MITMYRRSTIFGSRLAGKVEWPVLKSRADNAAVDADGGAAYVIGQWAGQERDGRGNLLRPAQAAHVIWGHGLDGVALDLLPRLAPAMSRCQTAVPCPTCLRKDRAGSHDV